MKKLFYAAFAACAILMAQSCGNNTANTSDSPAADTNTAADTTAIVQADSATTVKTDSTVAQTDSTAIAKAEDAKKASANAAKIDKLLKEFKKVEKDIRTQMYPNGQYVFQGRITEESCLGFACNVDRKLKKLKNEMTPKQKSQYEKTRKSVKKLLSPSYKF